MRRTIVQGSMTSRRFDLVSAVTSRQLHGPGRTTGILRDDWKSQSYVHGSADWIDSDLGFWISMRSRSRLDLRVTKRDMSAQHSACTRIELHD